MTRRRIGRMRLRTLARMAPLAVLLAAPLPCLAQSARAPLPAGSDDPAMLRDGSRPVIPPEDPAATHDGSRPVVPHVATPAAAGSAAPRRQVRIEHIDAIFETLPVPFDREVAFSADNLHFVPIKTAKGTIVLAWGGIGEGDAIRFQAALAAAKPVREVQFYSPGGSLPEGMKIGRIIRGQMLATRITSGAWCASACDFMFLGGVVRTVESGGRFGVHMFSTNQAQALVADLAHPPASVDEFNDRFPKLAVKPYQVRAWVEQENAEAPTNRVTERDYFRQGKVYREIVDERVRDIQQYSAQTAAQIALFLVEMRLSLRFLVEFADQTSYGLHVMTPEELRSYNVVTN